MKKLIIAILAASTAGVVYAQAETQDQKSGANDFRVQMRTLIEGDGMKVDDLANLMQNRAQARFEALDEDGNGIVTKEEYLAATAERAETRFERMNPDEDGIVKRGGREGWGRHHAGGPRHEMRGGKERGNPEQRAERQAERVAEQFTRFDADGDGSISREEFETAMKERADRFAERGKERGERREARNERRGNMPAEMREMHKQMRTLMREGMNLETFTGLMQDRATNRFEALDTDGNGEVTAAEFTANIAERAQHAFARMDRDDDGVVTSDDRPRWGGRHHGPRTRD